MLSPVLIAAFAGLVSGSPAPAIPASAVCSKLPYNLLVGLQVYPPVATWCSSSFPVADISTTVTFTPTTTSTSTILTTTTVPATSTAFATVSSTTTVTTITLPAQDQFAKRTAPTPSTSSSTPSTSLDASASASYSSRWKSATSSFNQYAKASAVASSACFCMQPPKTQTTTVTASAVTVQTSITSIETTTSTQLVQITQTVEADVTASYTPQSPIQTFSAGDGSKFLLLNNVQNVGQDTNIPGTSPISNVDSMDACSNICMQQGTKCVGASYTQSSRICLIKKLVPTNYNYNLLGTDIAIRMTGPAGVNTQQVQNRNFQSGSLGPWTSTTSKYGGPFTIINGAANISMPFATLKAGNGRDSAYLQQPISARAGQNFFVQMDFGYAMTYDPTINYNLGTVACTLLVTTDKDRLAYMYATSRNGNITVASYLSYGAGVLTGDATYVRATLSCNGGQDVTYAIRSISVKTYDASTGTNVIVPPQQKVLQNTRFTDNGSISPWRVSVSNDANNFGTASSGSLRLCLGPQPQYQRIGTISQPVPMIEQQQPYRIRAHIDVNIPNNAGSCNILLAMTNNAPAWQQDVGSSTSLDVDVRMDSVANDSLEFAFQMFCASTTVTMCMTLSNPELTYNV